MPTTVDDETIRALVFANGALNDGPAVQNVLSAAPKALVIAADGGARLAQMCGLRPHWVVGDMDSLSAEALHTLQTAGARIERHSPHKDESDLELALLAAVREGARWIRVLGAIGDRLDQTLANIALLSLDALSGCDVRLVAGRQTLWLIGAGEHIVHGRAGDTVSLLPLGGDAIGITTAGLEYPLRDETLRFGPARGVSNVMVGTRAQVRLRTGILAVIHTPGRA